MSLADQLAYRIVVGAQPGRGGVAGGAGGGDTGSGDSEASIGSAA